MGWRAGTDDGWVDVPVLLMKRSTGQKQLLSAEIFNELVEAIIERQTFAHAEDPTFTPTGIDAGHPTHTAYSRGVADVTLCLKEDSTTREPETHFETITGFEDTAWGRTQFTSTNDVSAYGCTPIRAAFINQLRDRIEELIESDTFMNPENFDDDVANHWAPYTVADLLPDGWEKVPDATDQFHPTPQTRDWSPGGPVYGAVLGRATDAVNITSELLGCTKIFSEFFNQMYEVLNKLIHVERDISPYTDGTYGGLAKLATTASGADRPTAVDNWEAGLGTITPVIANNTFGWVPSLFTFATPNYIISITGKGYQRRFYYFAWTHSIGIVQIKTKVKLYSYYQQADGNHALDAWSMGVYHAPGDTPGAITDADWDYGSASGTYEITGVHDPDWIAGDINTPSVVPDYPGVGVAKYATDDKVYLQMRCREDQPDVLDAVTWPASPTTYTCIAYQDVPNGMSAAHTCLVRVAFEYDDRTP